MSLVTQRGGVSTAPTGELVGRHTELDRLCALLAAGVGLIALIGPGGIGKTRLAAEALRRTDSEHRPVYWARLADGEDGQSRPSATACDTVRAAHRPNDTEEVLCPSTPEALLDIFTSGDYPTDHAVLVLDSCEHLLSQVGELVGQLFAVVPGLTILATSREPIGWVDEYLVMVPPLAPRYALELFVQRAELVGRRLSDEPAQLADAARICRRVDYNPLFIRLAAARLRHQPPAMVLRELTGGIDDQRMSWAHGARAGVDPRHRRVYDVVAWSFALCSETEQVLLERLSIFATGYDSDDEAPRTGIDLDAVIAVCADERLPAHDIEYLLERLTERSLLAAHLAPESMSWYILESVHVFALQRLRERDPAEAMWLAARHRRHFRDRIVAGTPWLRNSHDRALLSWVRSAWNDILLGIETGIDDPVEAQVALETATMLLGMWVPFVKGGNRTLTRMSERALAAAERGTPDRALIENATRLLCWAALWQGRVEDAERLLEDSVTERADTELPAGWRAAVEDNLGLPASVDWMCGLGLMLIEQDPRAVRVTERARDKYAAVDDVVGVRNCEVVIAFAAALLGDEQQALGRTERYLLEIAPTDHGMPTAWAQIVRAIALAKHGLPDAAEILARDVLAKYRGSNDVWTTSWAVGACILVAKARLARGADAAERGAAATEIAQLVGGFKVRSHAVGVVLERVPLLAMEVGAAVNAACEVLGERAYATAERRIRSLGTAGESRERRGAWWCQSYPTSTKRASRAQGSTEPPTALDAGIEEADSRDGSTRARWDQLSAAERDVAVLAAAGWPNSAIAARRCSSIRTVDAQVATVRQKLMITSRTDIVAFVPDDLADRVRRESYRKPGRGRSRTRTG